MGIDFFDLTIGVEKEFQIKLEQGYIMQMLDEGDAADLPEGTWGDIRVSQYVRYIEATIAKQHSSVPNDVYERVKAQLIKCLGVAPSEVTPEAWLIRDLKME